MTIFFGCQVPNKQNNSLEVSANCLNPTDAIYKFENTDVNSFQNSLITTLNNDGKILDEEEIILINEWVENEVFGVKSESSNILEWNLFDQDFCVTKQMISKLDGGPYKGMIDTMKINLCNSLINEDVINNNFPLNTLQLQGHKINISMCSKINTSYKTVPYYEIHKNDKGNYVFEGAEKMKHLVKLEITLHINSDEKSSSVLLLTDQAYMYSGFYNIDSTDYINNKIQIANTM